jgi:hypothetical protein
MKRHPEEFSDTDPRALEVWMELLRSKTPGERIEMAFDLTEFALQMAESGVRGCYPRGFGTRDFPALRGPAHSPRFDDSGLRMGSGRTRSMSAPSAAFARLLEVLDRMGIPYLVGGSVASSAHGVPRTTLDVDLVVDLKPEQIEEFRRT